DVILWAGAGVGEARQVDLGICPEPPVPGKSGSPRSGDHSRVAVRADLHNLVLLFGRAAGDVGDVGIDDESIPGAVNRDIAGPVDPFRAVRNHAEGRAARRTLAQ